MRTPGQRDQSQLGAKDRQQLIVSELQHRELAIAGEQIELEPTARRLVIDPRVDRPTVARDDQTVRNDLLFQALHFCPIRN